MSEILRDIVFTALFGKYETLNELVIEKGPNCRYVCFTDDSTLRSETWEIVVVKSSLQESPSRSSREIKMLGHRYFPAESRTLYIDNTVKLKGDGSRVLDFWLKDGDLAFMRHYSRRTVRGEFFACSCYGLDEQDKIWNQYNFYRQNFRKILRNRPYWGGMIARVNNSQADKFMKTWNDQFNQYTRRDQLSINVSEHLSGVSIKTIEGGNDSSEWHDWPIHSNRNTNMRETFSGKRFRKIRIIVNGFRFGIYFYVPALRVLRK